jgi:hypothetical protein
MSEIFILDKLYGAKLINGLVELTELSNVLITSFDKQLIYQNRLVVKKGVNYVIENHDYTNMFTLFQINALNKLKDDTSPLRLMHPLRYISGNLYIPLLAVQVLAVYPSLIEEHNILRFWMETQSLQVQDNPINTKYSGTIFMENWRDSKMVASRDVLIGTDTKSIAALSEYALQYINELDILSTKK